MVSRWCLIVILVYNTKYNLKVTKVTALWEFTQKPVILVWNRDWPIENKVYIFYFLLAYQDFFLRSDHQTLQLRYYLMHEQFSSLVIFFSIFKEIGESLPIGTKYCEYQFLLNIRRQFLIKFGLCQMLEAEAESREDLLLISTQVSSS